MVGLVGLKGAIYECDGAGEGERDETVKGVAVRFNVGNNSLV